MMSLSCWGGRGADIFEGLSSRLRRGSQVFLLVGSDGRVVGGSRGDVGHLDTEIRPVVVVVVYLGRGDVGIDRFHFRFVLEIDGMRKEMWDVSSIVRAVHTFIAMAGVRGMTGPTISLG